jgi:hypothetical protein
MSKPKVAILGASSKSASFFVEVLKRENFAVKTYSSSEQIGSEFRFNLYESHIPTLACDYAIYFSWAKNRNQKDQKAAERKALDFARVAQQQGVKVIFISSLASLPSRNKSFYGSSKRAVELGMIAHGHTVIRPGTIISTKDPEMSSAMQQLHKYRTFVWIYARLSERVLVPLIGIEAFSSCLLNLIKNYKVEELNLFEEVKTLENLAGFRDFYARIPLKWGTFFKFLNRGEATDRLLTLLSVSGWLRENQV